MTTATTANTSNGHRATTQPDIDTNANIINHLAEKLRGIDIINGACVAVESTVRAGIIDATVTQVAFGGESVAVRVILHPTPVPVDPPPARLATTDTAADPLPAGNDK